MPLFSIFLLRAIKASIRFLCRCLRDAAPHFYAATFFDTPPNIIAARGHYATLRRLIRCRFRHYFQRLFSFFINCGLNQLPAADTYARCRWRARYYSSTWGYAVTAADMRDMPADAIWLLNLRH